MISFESVSRTYPSKPALLNVSFSLKQGELLFITGASGAGKSTLLRLASLLELPSQGEVYLGGHQTQLLKPKDRLALRQHIGLVMQNPRLLSHQSLWENVALPLYIAGYSKARVARRVDQVLQAVELQKWRSEPVDHLSVGQRQRAGLARAMVHSPSILIADEPTGNLDHQLASDIMSLFSRFAESGTTVLVATHDLSLVQAMRRPCLILKDHKVRALLQGSQALEIERYVDQNQAFTTTG